MENKPPISPDSLGKDQGKDSNFFSQSKIHCLSSVVYVLIVFVQRIVPVIGLITLHPTVVCPMLMSE